MCLTYIDSTQFLTNFFTTTPQLHLACSHCNALHIDTSHSCVPPFFLPPHCNCNTLQHTTPHCNALNIETIQAYVPPFSLPLDPRPFA